MGGFLSAIPAAGTIRGKSVNELSALPGDRKISSRRRRTFDKRVVNGEFICLEVIQAIRLSLSQKVKIAYLLTLGK